MHEARTRNYLLYAAGEILLVIIGILIALQVNNWNQDRIEQQQVRRYAHALISDLQSDIEMVNPIVQMIDNSLRKVSALDAYTRGRRLDQIDNLDLWQLTTDIGYRAFEWNRTTFEQMKSAGALEAMTNFELARKIAAYYALTHHLDQDYLEDTERVQQADALAYEVVDSGYPPNQQADEWWQQSFRDPLEFPSARLHEIYADAPLPLLTEDVRKVRVMSNKYQATRSMQVRSQHEIPKLVADANELIGLLQKEYPDY